MKREVKGRGGGQRDLTNPKMWAWRPPLARPKGRERELGFLRMTGRAASPLPPARGLGKGNVASHMISYDSKVTICSPRYMTCKLLDARHFCNDF